MLRTTSERLIFLRKSQQREGEQSTPTPAAWGPQRKRPGRLCRRRDEREPTGSLSYFAWSPELDDVLLAHYGHLAPALFVIGRAGVSHGEVVIGRDHAPDLVQRL